MRGHLLSQEPKVFADLGKVPKKLTSLLSLGTISVETQSNCRRDSEDSRRISLLSFRVLKQNTDLRNV